MISAFVIAAIVLCALAFGKPAVIALLRWCWPSMGGGGN